MRAAILPERSVVRLSGADAAHFLNNLVTSEVGTLKPGEARFAALLTPQGKILFDFFVVACGPDEGDGYVFDVPRALTDDFVQRLNFYKLRAKVTIEPRPDLAVAVVFDGTPLDELGLEFPDPRLAGLGTRVILPREGAEAALATATLVDGEAWQQLRIALGVPEGGKDFIYSDTFPHEAAMDTLNGVDFEKGCFIGQEVVSRMQHRGGARKRVVPVAYQDGAPMPGVEIKAGDKSVGFMGSAANGRGLAMLRLDRVEEALAAGGTIMGGGIALTLVESGQ
ncbi:MAG TPA: folate-binding protein [Xanthobacteraceae bacterium]|jgi:hypothetical protein